MTDDDAKPLTVSREDLYELVWSKPMRDLAQDFDIRCRACQALPPIGHPGSGTRLLGSGRCRPDAPSSEAARKGAAMV